MLNRKNSPALAELSIPPLLPHSSYILSNGIELIVLQDAMQEAFKLDILFEAGTCHQPQPLIASTAINMLNEGTQKHVSAEIAETFDFYGSYVDFNCGMHKVELNLISLNKYAERTIPLLAEMITDSIIPEKELEIYLRNKRQQFLVDCEKTSWLARKEFSRVLFGDQHPYANVIKESDYKAVGRQSVLTYYKERINAHKCTVLLSGNITPELLTITQKAFSTLGKTKNDLAENEHIFTPHAPGRYCIPKADAVQTSLRIGKQGLRLTDTDYAVFQLLNTVLGGYFGSRLMSNIREDKGYTYGINSFNVSMPLTSYWCIATDVSTEYTEPTIIETLKEIKRIQSELIPDEELNLVKNYLHGDLLRELDGVFSQSDALKHKLTYGTDNQFYISVIDRIRQCSAKELREVANKYLNIDELYFVIAGNTDPIPR